MDTFWDEIEGQCDRLSSAEGVEDVVRILRDPRYVAVAAYGAHNTGPDAFYAGSGGDVGLYQVLCEAGWLTAWYREPYWWAMVAPDGSGLTYVEGDVFRGVQKPPPGGG